MNLAVANLEWPELNSSEERLINISKLFVVWIARILFVVPRGTKLLRQVGITGVRSSERDSEFVPRGTTVPGE